MWWQPMKSATRQDKRLFLFDDATKQRHGHPVSSCELYVRVRKSEVRTSSAARPARMTCRRSSMRPLVDMV